MTRLSVAGASAERAALAALGRDLCGPSGARRAEALLASRPAAPTSFSELRRAPAWLRLSPDEVRGVARRASLQSSAATLAASIDGALLGQVAEACGEDALDEAIAAAEPADDRPIPPAGTIEADGLALLAAVLPMTLHGYLPAGDAPVPPFADADRARGWVERAAAVSA